MPTTPRGCQAVSLCGAGVGAGEQIEWQLTTTIIGSMNVKRAVLPIMRTQRSGHVLTISSSAGFPGFEYGTAYAASNFGVQGFMESLAPEVEPFGIHTTIVNPGFFRTELLTNESTNYATASIDDYAQRNARPARVLGGPERPAAGRPGQARPGAANPRQARPAAAALHRRADAIAQAEQQVAQFQTEINAYRDLSLSALDEAQTAAIPSPA
jgi:NAD(P)-dependent dehydrogenase (short-subunit alcohol dehydrogenase family)